MTAGADRPRPLVWCGASQAEFAAFSRDVQREMGYALFLAQMGERHPTKTKVLRGFGEGSVVEV